MSLQRSFAGKVRSSWIYQSAILSMTTIHDFRSGDISNNKASSNALIMLPKCSLKCLNEMKGFKPALYEHSDLERRLIHKLLIELEIEMSIFIFHFENLMDRNFPELTFP
ncbi:unnamed protein product [Arabis nemorensis]|uniref:Uncharacterized protein n=1 Tax=Arabis nemorensis TaxID=586526 RepID=A0A565AWS8_9BRAS|nr:unnamed protein product [Arabis nemorensis]